MDIIRLPMSHFKMGCLGAYDRQSGKDQGRHPRQGGASVSGDQASVRIFESALSRFEEEHRPTCHTVCVVKFVDGARQTDGSAGMSAHESRGNALQWQKSSPMGAKNGATLKTCE